VSTPSSCFVDELNKYAPADGPETYVKKMLLDISERGRYLGWCCSRRAVPLPGAPARRGKRGYHHVRAHGLGRARDPRYQVLSPATKIKLATLPIGELMVRHPHFTQPISCGSRGRRLLRGRDGVERFPPAADLPFEDAVVRQLVKLDGGCDPIW